MKLTLGSEQFAATGGVEATGARRLLGAPGMPLLHTLLREAGQNSCDAATGTGPVRFVIRLRHLSDGRLTALRAALEILPPDSESSRAIADFLASSSAGTVLEICDYGTRGLGGPTRADEPSAPGVRTDFVDFIRNIGVSRDVAHGGGTYGYGKSVLYSASLCSAIIVDSLTEEGDRRFIGCHLGDPSETGEARLTGRHWWGAPSDHAPGFVEPVTGEDAVALSTALGMAPRSAGEAGVSIMILDPRLNGDTFEECAGEVAEALLWFFWPRMIGDGAGRLTCCIEIEGAPFAMPRPEAFAPIDLFVEAWRAVKSGGDGSVAIRSERPKKLLGRLAQRSGFRGPRTRLVAPEETIIPEACAHIAVMRPVDLVVRYFEGVRHANEMMEWAGVFICDDDHEVEAAFAASEPPAHDDWAPASIPKGSSRTYVNVALREIRKAAETYAAPPPLAQPDGNEAAQPALARAAEVLGAAVPAAAREGRNGGGTRRARAAQAFQISAPVFAGLHQGAAGIEAVFSVRAMNRSGDTHLLHAVPGLILDGVLTSEQIGPDGDSARVIAWESADGARVGVESNISIDAGAAFEGSVRISVPRLSAVGLELRAQSAAS